MCISVRPSFSMRLPYNPHIRAVVVSLVVVVDFLRYLLTEQRLELNSGPPWCLDGKDFVRLG